MQNSIWRSKIANSFAAGSPGPNHCIQWFGRAQPEVFERYHRQRHQLATEFLQSVTIENKKRIEEKDPEVIKANQKILRENAEDPAKAKAWLMRSSLLDSVRQEETIE